MAWIFPGQNHHGYLWHLLHCQQDSPQAPGPRPCSLPPPPIWQLLRLLNTSLTTDLFLRSRNVLLFLQNLSNVLCGQFFLAHSDFGGDSHSAKDGMDYILIDVVSKKIEGQSLVPSFSQLIPLFSLTSFWQAKLCLVEMQIPNQLIFSLS